ncbi:MAG: YbdK family carboxylate-amine ligase [Gemmatimonadetes bacterium]|nr:YbdK family carboxylate-amine ligase [Gemmatimonadota bacterium]
MGRDLTLGIEEEYQICDARSGDLAPGIERLLAAAPPGLRQRLSYELLHTVLESNTAVADTVEDATAKLADLRRQLFALAEPLELALGLSGTHPFANWRAQRFVDTPDYQWVGDQLRYLALRNLSFGLHVHVGVDDPEARVSVTNRLRRWMAPLLALSASSPFLEGVVTGFQSIRTQVFGSFPRTGFPPVFRSHADYMAAIAALVAAGSITKPRQVWWNVRPRETFRTVEVRVMDVQLSLRRVRGFAAVAQALVAAHLREIRDGLGEQDLREAFLSDALFKAMRFGLEARIPDAVNGSPRTMRDAVEEMLEWALPAASELGTEADLSILEEILERGTEADTQLELLREVDDISRVQLRLLERAREEVAAPSAT